MTELEKDRLIEAFMGWKLSWNNEEGKRGWSFYNELSKEYLHKTTYANSTIGFTTDWNWLMKALKKFDELYDNDKIICTLGNSNYKNYSELRDQIDYAITLYSIDDTVNALCKGIKWYNLTLNQRYMEEDDRDDRMNDYPSFQSDRSFIGGREPIDD